MVSLSILICSLHKRKDSLHSLLASIENQDAAALAKTEVLISVDGGQKAIGKKRNELMKSASGDYVVFIDDDDLISDDYLVSIFKGISMDVDHVGIAMQITINNGHPALVYCSKNNKWETRNGIFYRGAQHVCAIKRQIASQVKYPEINFGEDKEYSEKINALIETEYLITEPIYFYNYKSNK